MNEQPSPKDGSPKDGSPKDGSPDAEIVDGSTPSMVELYIDTDLCVGMGVCEVVEPTVFEINDEAISEVIGSALFKPERAEKVMFECPTGAIKSRSHKG